MLDSRNFFQMTKGECKFDSLAWFLHFSLKVDLYDYLLEFVLALLASYYTIENKFNLLPSSFNST